MDEATLRKYYQNMFYELRHNWEISVMSGHDCFYECNGYPLFKTFHVLFDKYLEVTFENNIRSTKYLKNIIKISYNMKKDYFTIEIDLIIDNNYSYKNFVKLMYKAGFDKITTGYVLNDASCSGKTDIKAPLLESYVQLHYECTCPMTSYMRKNDYAGEALNLSILYESVFHEFFNCVENP